MKLNLHLYIYTHTHSHTIHTSLSQISSNMVHMYNCFYNLLCAFNNVSWKSQEKAFIFNRYIVFHGKVPKNQFSSSYLNRHLGCFDVFAILNHAINSYVHMSFIFYHLSLRQIPRRGASINTYVILVNSANCSAWPCNICTLFSDTYVSASLQPSQINVRSNSCIFLVNLMSRIQCIYVI